MSTATLYAPISTKFNDIPMLCTLTDTFSTYPSLSTAHFFHILLISNPFRYSSTLHNCYYDPRYHETWLLSRVRCFVSILSARHRSVNIQFYSSIHYITLYKFSITFIRCFSIFLALYLILLVTISPTEITTKYYYKIYVKSYIPQNIVHSYYLIHIQLVSFYHHYLVALMPYRFLLLLCPREV